MSTRESRPTPAVVSVEKACPICDQLSLIAQALSRMADEQARTNESLIHLLKYEDEDDLDSEHEGDDSLSGDRGRVIRRTP